MTAAITLPLVAMGKSAVESAAQFEQSMALLGLALGDSGSDMETVRGYALKMGADTVFSAQEMSDAMTGLAKAGQDWSTIAGDMTGKTGTLAAATNLAAASDLTLTQAADAVAIAMATFGLSAEDAVPIVDNFVMTADASVTSVAELTDALANVGPTAAAFGWSLEDTNTALAILSERGIRGGEAGTALKSMMTNLMRPTADVQDALKALNVSLYDSEGKMRTLPDIIADLSVALYGTKTVMEEVGGRTKEQNDELARLTTMYTKTKTSLADYEAGIKGAGLSEKERAQKVGALNLELLNLQTAMNPLLALQGDMVTSTRTLTEEERNQYVQMLAGTYGMKAMQTLLAEGVTGWDGMTTAIAGANDAQTVANAKMGGFAGMWEQLKGSLETVAITFGTLIIPILSDLLTNYVMPFLDWLMQLNPEILKWGLVLAGVAAAIGPLLVGLGGLVAIIGTIGLPVAAAIAGLAALAAIVGVAAYAMRDTFAAMWAQVAPIVEQVRAWLAEKLPQAAAAMQAFMAPIIAAVSAFITEMFQKVVTWFVANWPLMQQTFETIVTAIQSFWDAHGQQIMDAVTIVWETVKTIISTVLDVILNTVTLVMQLINGDWEAAHNTLLSIAQSVWTLIQTLFTGILSAILALFDQTLDALVQVWRNNWQMVQLIFTTIWTNIQTFVISALSQIWTAITTTLNNIYTTMVNILTAFWNFWRETFNTVYNHVNGVLQAIWAAISNFSLFDVGAKLVEGLKNGIMSKAGEVASRAAQLVTDAINAARAVLGMHSPSAVFADIGENIDIGLANGIDALSMLPREALGGLIGQMQDDMANIPTIIGEAIGQEIVTGVASGIDALSGLPREALGGLVGQMLDDMAAMQAGAVAAQATEWITGNIFGVPDQAGTAITTPVAPPLIVPTALQADQSVTVNFNAPVNVRDESDIDALADMIARRNQMFGAYGVLPVSGV